MPSVISLNLANKDQLYQATVPAGTTVSSQTLKEFVQDSKFAGLFANSSIPKTKLQALDASNISVQSLSGASGQPGLPGQLAWYTINSYNIAPSGLDTVNYNGRSITGDKIALNTIKLENLESGVSGGINAKVNKSGDTMTGALSISASAGTWGENAALRLSATSDPGISFNNTTHSRKVNLILNNDANAQLSVAGGYLGNTVHPILHAGNWTNYINNPTGYVPLAGGTMTGDLTVRSGATVGSVSLKTGSTTQPGYIEFRQPNGVRAGYIGWSSSTNTIDIKSEDNHVFNFTTAPTVIGRSIPLINNTDNSLNIDGKITATGGIDINAGNSAGDCRLEIGVNNGSSPKSRNAYVDLISNADESDYNLRLYRFTGPNSDGGISKKGGSGALRIINEDNASVIVSTYNVPRIRIEGEGDIYCEGNKIRDIALPEFDTDAANAGYVNSVIKYQTISKIQNLVFNTAGSKSTSLPGTANFTCYSGNIYNRRVFEGVYIVLALPNITYTSNTIRRIYMLIDMLDDIYAYNLKNNSDVHPRAYSTKEYNGKMVILVVDTSVFGAGAAIVGYKGIEITKEAWDFYYDTVINNNKDYPVDNYELAPQLPLLSLIPYEYYRCFLYSEEKIEYDIQGGTVTTGMAVTMRKITMDALGFKGSLYFDKRTPLDETTMPFSLFNQYISNLQEIWMQNSERNFYNSYLPVFLEGSAIKRTSNKVSIDLVGYNPYYESIRGRNFVIGDIIEVSEVGASKGYNGIFTITGITSDSLGRVIKITYEQEGSDLERDFSFDYSIRLNLRPPNILNTNDYLVYTTEYSVISTVSPTNRQNVVIRESKVIDKKTKSEVPISNVPLHFSGFKYYKNLDLVRDNQDNLYVRVKNSEVAKNLSTTKNEELEWVKIGYMYIRQTDVFASVMYDLQKRFGTVFFTKFFKELLTLNDVPTSDKLNWRGQKLISDLNINKAIDNICKAASLAAGANLYTLFTEVYKIPVSRLVRAQLTNTLGGMGVVENILKP